MTLQLNNATNNVQIDFDAGAGTNRTATFPDASGTVALAGAAGGLAGNISRATLFRLNTDFSTNDAVITGWETPDQAGESAGVGGAVTEASGVFTFPVTGVWLVAFTGRWNVAEGDMQVDVVTQLTTNGGTNWGNRAVCSTGNSSGNEIVTSHTGFALFDITNTADRQVRFSVSSLAAGGRLIGGTDRNFTAALFLRLGDT